MSGDKEQRRLATGERLRRFRLSCGHRTAASFARAIGYPPDRYRRYEHRGFQRSGPMLQLVRTIERTGFGAISLDWLFGTKFSGPVLLHSYRINGRPRLRVVS